MPLTPDQQAMLLKMGWAAHAIERGVERAHIIDCEDGRIPLGGGFPPLVLTFRTQRRHCHGRGD